MNTRKILYLADSLLPPGGIQTLSSTCIQILREMANDGVVKYGAIARRGKIPPDVECASLNGSGAGMQFRVARDWFLRRANLILSDHLYTARFASRIGARHIFWAHLIEFEPPLAPMHQKSMESCYKIYCDSHFTERYLAGLYPAVRSKLRTVHLGDSPRQPLTAPRYRDNVPNQRLTMIGRMASEEQYKGHDQVIEAMPELLKRYPQCEVSMIGGGNDRARLQSKVEQLGLSRHVRFLSHLDDEQLFEVVKGSCGVLLPSRKEAFGLVYLYALWAGIPAVALRGTAGEEVLGDCGVYADNQTHENLTAALSTVLSGTWHHAEASQRRYRESFCYGAFKKRLKDVLTIDLAP